MKPTIELNRLDFVCSQEEQDRFGVHDDGGLGWRLSTHTYAIPIKFARRQDAERALSAIYQAGIDIDSMMDVPMDEDFCTDDEFAQMVQIIAQSMAW